MLWGRTPPSAFLPFLCRRPPCTIAYSGTLSPVLPSSGQRKNNESECHERGVGAMTDVESNLQTDIIEPTEADPLTPEWVRYLASVAMTAAATIVSIAVDG